MVAGTRISVELILDKLGAGDSVDDVLTDQPDLTREQVLAAVRFAARTLRLDSFHPTDDVAARGRVA